MGGNLAKTPLIAAFYAGLLWLGLGLVPRSAAYTELTNAFVMPRRGLLLLAVYALVVAIAFAIVFSHARAKGMGVVIPLVITTLGVQWLAPMLVQLLRGETTAVMTKADTIFQLLGGFCATALTLVLCMLLFKSEEKPLRPGAPKPVEPKYKLNMLGLVIRLLVLPVIFMVLFYLLWYFLLWRVDAVRVYYGASEKLTFMAAIIDILINDNVQVLIALLQGLVYALFSLPLLLQLPGKRVMFIAANALLYVSGGLLYLIPSPVMSTEVATAHLLENAVLLLVYGVISAVLLHTALRRPELPPAAARPAGKQAQPAGKQTQPAGKSNPPPAAADKK